ncbi:MAG: hypothetical protein IJP82_06950 [Bacteroidaceae bacterium]|nr:hypothetical protein [Bacteroidaceae bacterium]
MKQFFLFFFLMSASVVLKGQEVATDSLQTDSTVISKSVELKEVTIKAERVVQTDEGMKVFPTEKQLEASPNGYSLLQKLSLPGIKVDEVMHTVSSPELIGSVQVRINDVVASMQDLLSLDMAMVQSIDYITSPGLRYGEGVAYVIDIHVLRPMSGYVAGGNILQSLNSRRNTDDVYFRLNHGKSEFSLGYDFSWTDFRGYRFDDRTDYLLADGTTASVITRSISYKNPNIHHGLSLKYSLAEEEKYLFLATLSQGFNHSPSYHNQQEVVMPLATDTVNYQSKDRNNSTQLDLYFNLRLPHAQTLTANAVGTFVGSRYRYSSDAVSLYQYEAKGKTYSLTSEALYENRLKPFTLSAGVKYHQQYIGNEYSGDVLRDNPLRESGQYFYAQLRGALIPSLTYRAGMGVSHLHYSQSGTSYSYWVPRPNVLLNYKLTPSLSVNYVFNLKASVPRIAYITDVTQTNKRVMTSSVLVEELNVGNPDIKVTPNTEHSLKVTYTSPHLVNNFHAMFRNCHRTYMQDITRQTLPDGTTQFLFSRSNQRSIKMLYVMDDLTLHLIPETLDLSLNGSFLRCFNFGDHYTHCRSTFMGGADLQAYLGNFALSFHYDSGWHFLEGEGKGDNSYSTYLTASYQLGKWGTLSLFWQHLFDSNVRQEQFERLNRYLHRMYTAYSTDIGNMISVQLTVNLSHGRKYQTKQQTLKNTAVDAGVVKQE